MRLYWNICLWDWVWRTNSSLSSCQCSCPHPPHSKRQRSLFWGNGTPSSYRSLCSQPRTPEWVAPHSWPYFVPVIFTQVSPQHKDKATCILVWEISAYCPPQLCHTKQEKPWGRIFLAPSHLIGNTNEWCYATQAGYFPLPSNCCFPLAAYGLV